MQIIVSLGLFGADMLAIPELLFALLKNKLFCYY